MVRSSPLSKATPLRVPPPTSSRTPTRRSSLLSNTSREIDDDDDDDDENENENDHLDEERHAFMGSMFSTDAARPPRPPPSRNASSRPLTATTTTRTPTTTHEFTTETPERIARSRADARRHLRAALSALALAEDEDSAASVRVALSRLGGTASPS